ncbi:unnamed protein product [Oreochromis niloticus]|nr:unnamed protein product [Mustela putorius furo]
MNVISACWNDVFAKGKSAFHPQKLKSRRAWKEAFAVCQQTATTKTDGFLGYVRPASRRGVKVPPNCEVMVWGRTCKGKGGTERLALVEALPDAGPWGVARTLSVVKGGRLPIRVCNPNPYEVTIGRYQKMGQLYQVEESDVEGDSDLSLTVGSDGVIEVGVVEAAGPEEPVIPEEEVSQLINGIDLTPQQKAELQTLLQRWRKVFAVNEEDYGRTDLVQHQIHTAVGERPAEAVATWTEAEAGQMFPTDCQTAYINTTSAPCRDPQGLVPQMNDWKEAQEKDMDLRILREYVERGVPPDAPTRGSLPSPVQKLLHQWRRLQVCEGTLCREVRDPNTNEMYLQILCPAERHKEVWEKYHEAAAHAGVEKTLSRIRRFFYWPSMEEEVREFQLGCAACSLRDRNRPRAPLHPIIVSYPLEIVALDFLTLGRPTDRYQNILVMTDLFRRYAWAVPTKDQTAQTAVHALWAHVIQTFGCPTRLHSDRGGSFESALMYQLCKCYGITKSKTTPYHPAGNGGVERMNQTLLHMLRSLESERQQRWPEYLPELLQAYNNTVHSATGYAPSYLMFGRHLRQPVDLSLGVERESPCHDLGGWVKDHHQKLSFAYEMARKKMRAAATQNKRAYDRSARALPLVPGERVWIRDRNRQGQGKLHPGWSSEPYVVVEEVGNTGVVYKVQPEKGGGEKVLHRNALKLCITPVADHHPEGQGVSLEGEMLVEPPFYGFVPSTPAQQPRELSEVRRSTRPNFGWVSDPTSLGTSQALQGLEAHLPPPLHLPVADALRHRCIGGSLCPGVGAQVPTGSLLGGCLSGHGAWGSLGPLRGWGALGLSARGSVTQAQLAAGGAHGHVTATPPGFCSAAAE